MNNALVMSASFEARKNSQASMITAGFAGLMLLLMFLLKWSVPVMEPPPVDQGILVDLNIPEEEVPVTKINGGGGGGNPVEAAGPKGIAQAAPPLPGTNEDAKDVEEDKEDKVSPAILKPDVPKPTATKINENKSPVKAEPKPDPPPPAPQRPKAVLGKTTTGSGNGGGAVATTYDRAGGSGTGNGVGNGSGSGGGTGTGTGGGNGSGTGTGTGPRVTRGDRRIVASYSFTGDLERATIFADIKVTPDGVGQFLQFARGTTNTSSAYRTAITQYLKNIRFNKSDHESTVTVQFNFKVNG